jgi:hypothetical protein
MQLEQTYEPPSEKEIDKYQSQLYPKWVNDCEGTLKRLHTIAQNALSEDQFNFYARNRGSRPAKDALVTVHAKGNFKLIASKRDDDDDAEVLELPDPPKTPTGLWAPKGFSGFSALQRMALLGSDPMRSSARHQASMMHDFRRLSLDNFHRRDANKFYWKSRPPIDPGFQICVRMRTVASRRRPRAVLGAHFLRST